MVSGSPVRQKTACFTGHRSIKEAPSAVSARTADAVRALYERGYTDFCAGGARGFDALAAQTVLSLRAELPDIRLILILPFDDQYEKEKGWSEAEIRQYREIKESAAEVVILSGGAGAYAYHRRNRELVDRSSVCIAYLERLKSGTGYTVKYALDSGLEIINIA